MPLFWFCGRRGPASHRRGCAARFVQRPCIRRCTNRCAEARASILRPVQARDKTFAPEALEKYPTLASACVHGNTAAPPGPCFRMHATASGRPSAMNYPVYTSLQPCQLGVIEMRTMTARLTFLSNWWRQARGDLRFDGKSEHKQREVARSDLSGRGARRPR